MLSPMMRPKTCSGRLNISSIQDKCSKNLCFSPFTPKKSANISLACSSPATSYLFQQPSSSHSSTISISNSFKWKIFISLKILFNISRLRQSMNGKSIEFSRKEKQTPTLWWARERKSQYHNYTFSCLSRRYWHRTKMNDADVEGGHGDFLQLFDKL